MRFQVPQFIEMESSVIGPLTFRQFAYLVGGGGLSYICYRFIPLLYIALIVIIPIIALSLSLAFYKPNGRPFIHMVESALIFAFTHKLYIWKKENKPLMTREVQVTSKKGSVVNIPKNSSSESSLSNIAWNIEVHSKNSVQQ